MKEKTKIGLALTLCLLLCFVIQYFSSHLFDVLIFGLTILSVLEFKKLLLKSGMPTFDYCPELACFLIFVTLFAGVLCGLSAMIILLIELAIVALFKKDLQNDKFRDLSNMSVKRFAFFKANNTLSCILYPTILMFFLYLINHIQSLGLVGIEANTKGAPMGLFGLILLFATVCLSDTFAMIFGCLIKGKKIFPKISPKKTISGSICGLLGGIIGALLTGLVFSWIFPSVLGSVQLWKYIIVGFVGSIVAQAGDLFESYMKRKANVKDAGDLFKSHGGVLDRMDSIIFAAPYFFICLLFMFG